MLQRACGDSDLALLFRKRSWFEHVYLFLGIDKVMFISFIHLIQCLHVFFRKSFARHAPGTVPGAPFPCIPAKRSFRSAAGQSPFLVICFWLLPLLFLRQHGRSVPAQGVAWRSVPGLPVIAGEPLPFPRCVVP